MTGGKNRIMIYGPRDDGSYVVEFKTAEGHVLAISTTSTGKLLQPRRFGPRQMKKYVLAAVATLGLLGPAIAQSQADAEDDETACLIGRAAVFLQSREGDDIDARLVAEYATEHAYSVCPSGALSGRSHAYVVGAIEALAEDSFEKADDVEQRDLPIFFRGGWCRTADDPGAPGDSVFERQQRGQQCPPGDALTITRDHLNGMLAGKALNCRVEVSTPNKNGHWWSWFVCNGIRQRSVLSLDEGKLLMSEFLNDRK